jgi:metallophosphoesterase superfamily enzyme
MIELKPEGLADAAAEPVAVCGRQFVADKSGALYWPSQRTLLVADLIPESGAAGRGNGHAPPPAADLRQTLVRLAEAMDHYEPARVIALGDGGGNGTAAPGLAADSLEILRILQEEREWIWLTGRPHADIAPQLGGIACSELEVSGLTLRHRPTPSWATHEIAASLRPAARLSMYGSSLRRACFVGNGRRLVMPAFAAFHDGRNVLDHAFRPLFGGSAMSVWLLGHGGLYPVATRLLAGD